MMKRSTIMLVSVLIVANLLGLGIKGVSQWDISSTATNVLAAEENPGKIFLPLLSNQTPYYQVFGIDLGKVTETNGLTLMTDAGAAWVRQGGYFWSKVEPKKGDRNWDEVAELENYFITAANSGLQLILPVYHTPEWAQKVPDSFCGPIKPEEYQAFANFMHDMVLRYSQPPYDVYYYEIWNEPDVMTVPSTQGFGCLIEDTNQDGSISTNEALSAGGMYADLLRYAYPAIKSANPKAQVLLGGLLMACDPDNPPVYNGVTANCAPTEFFDGILAHGGGDVFDGISFHTYDYYYGELDLFGNTNWNAGRGVTESLATIRAKADYLKDRLNQYDVTDRYIISTEIALLCDVDCTEDYEETKSNFVAQSYAEALAVGLRTNIWYNSLGTWRNSGLIYREDLTPRPAYYAYEFASQELMDATAVREITEYEGVKGFEFKRRGKTIWILWSFDGDSHTVVLPQTPTSVKDVYGAPLTNNKTISITPAPKYIEF